MRWYCVIDHRWRNDGLYREVEGCLALEPIPLIDQPHCSIMIDYVLVACEKLKLGLSSGSRVVHVEVAGASEVVSNDNTGSCLVLV